MRTFTMRINSGLSLQKLRLHTPAISTAFAALLGVIGIAVNTADLLRPTAAESLPAGNISTPVANRATHETAIDLSAIGALNLFGKVVVEAALNPANLPITQLNLKIAGIFSSTDPNHSRALITEDGKPAKTYLIGDALPGQAFLRGIDSEFVVIQRGDNMEKLPIHAGTLHAGIAEVSPAAQRMAGGMAISTPATTQSSATVSPPAPSPAVTDYHGLEDRLAAIRQKKSN